MERVWHEGQMLFGFWLGNVIKTELEPRYSGALASTDAWTRHKIFQGSWWTLGYAIFYFIACIFSNKSAYNILAKNNANFEDRMLRG